LSKQTIDIDINDDTVIDIDINDDTNISQN